MLAKMLATGEASAATCPRGPWPTSNQPAMLGDASKGGQRSKCSTHVFSPRVVNALTPVYAERAGHCCILGSCVGSAYMGGQP
jgi:hypothetical protein